MEEYSLQELGKRIQTARKAKKKTQDEVAAAIGVNKITVSDWERGLKQPGFLNILNYCNFLGITLDELLAFKKQRYLFMIVTEAERDAVLLLCAECQHEAEIGTLPKKLQSLEQSLQALFSRAVTK